MSKLWEHAGGLDKLAEDYTVGDDYLLDTYLLPYDIKGTLAHAKMLHKTGILTDDEYEKAAAGLDEIKNLCADGKFTVKPEQEDGHTAIEQFLSENYGEVGKKIHTGRSRNDQALTMIRLYMKDSLEKIEELLKKLAGEYAQKAEIFENLPMPGYTHMQKAMPTTAGAWLGAYGDAFLELTGPLGSVQTLIDQNPLGSAAGFGVKGVDIDREETTKELGFAKTQENPLYCGLSRGMFELAAVQQAVLISTLAGRFASDMMLFTTQEFGYFSLPVKYTTGSSIMPNKRNYDIFEIMRGNTGVVSSAQTQIQMILSGLGSGFHRDLQLSKGPLIKALETTIATLELLISVVPQMNADEQKLKDAMSEDLYATEKVYELVAQGIPFREAYQQVKKELFGIEDEK